MSSFYRKVELLANVAIVTLAILFGAVLVRRYLLHSPATAIRPQQSTIEVGRKIQISGYDWALSEQSLVFVLSTGCHFCTASGPFYQRLAQVSRGQSGLHLMAVLPQSPDESKQYLDRLGLNVDDIKQASPNSLGATGTPTLILVDRNGVTIKVWAGELPPSIEEEVLSTIRSYGVKSSYTSGRTHNDAPFGATSADSF